MKRYILPLLAIAVLLIASCKKEHYYSYLVYVNTLPSDIQFTVNGKTSTIPALSSISFTGDLGQPNPYTATTSGKTSSGTIIGIPINYSGTDFFPSGANATNQTTFTLNSADFYLNITNSSPYPFTELVVNAGSTDSTIDNISIPNDGVNRFIGYYHAYTNTVIDAYHTGGYYSNQNALSYQTDAGGNSYFTFIAQ